MEQFLRPERRQKTIQALGEWGIDPENGELVTDIKEGTQDQWLYAHTATCLEKFDAAMADDMDPVAMASIMWSGIIIKAIVEEAQERGWKPNVFPKAKPYLDALDKKVQEQKAKIATKH